MTKMNIVLRLVVKETVTITANWIAFKVDFVQC